MSTLNLATQQPLHGHLPHLLATGGFILVTLAVVLTYEATQRTPHAEPKRPPRQPRVPVCRAMAVTCAASAAVHLTVITDHLHESALLGAFFILLAITQAACGVLLSSPQPRASLVLAVAVASLSIATLWLTTRLTGIALGNVLLEQEPVGVSDILATSFELLTVLCAYAALRPARRAAKPLTPCTAYTHIGT